MKPKSLYLKLLFGAVMCMMLTIGVHAQSEITDATVTKNEVTGQAGVYSGAFIVLLSDSNDISKVEVQVGTENGSSDLSNKTFDWDVTTGLPSGCSYQRTGNTLTLGVGNFNETYTYFCRVRIRDNSGNWSNYYQFITN